MNRAKDACPQAAAIKKLPTRIGYRHASGDRKASLLNSIELVVIFRRLAQWRRENMNGPDKSHVVKN